MKYLISVLATGALAAVIVSGCTKSSSSDQSSTATTGPVTDSAATGMKPQESTAVAAGDAKHGSAIFNQNCSSCHGAAGVGGGIGPSLKGEKSRKDLPAAIAWIKNPKPPMPKLYPATISESDVADVAAYVETL